MANRHPDNIPSPQALGDLPLAELRDLYRVWVGSEPPPRIARAFLEGNVAWALQAHRRGEDPASLRQALLKAACRPKGGKAAYKPGTRLIREWQGQTHEVTVLDKGYRWQGRWYRSLSEIARHITGTRWSGPRFFGLARGS